MVGKLQPTGERTAKVEKKLGRWLDGSMQLPVCGMLFLEGSDSLRKKFCVGVAAVVSKTPFYPENIVTGISLSYIKQPCDYAPFFFPTTQRFLSSPTKRGLNMVSLAYTTSVFVCLIQLMLNPCEGK